MGHFVYNLVHISRKTLSEFYENFTRDVSLAKQFPVNFETHTDTPWWREACALVVVCNAESSRYIHAYNMTSVKCYFSYDF